MHYSITRLVTALLPLTAARKAYRMWQQASNRWRYGDAYFPRIISVEICTHCNRSCAYCPNSFQPQAAKLIDEKVLDAVVQRIAEIKWNGALDFIFFSEPLMHPKLAQIIARFKHACPSVIPRICTNGDLLTLDKVKALVKAGLQRIYVMKHRPSNEAWIANITSLKLKYPGLFVVMDIDAVERTDGLNDFGGKLKVNHRREPLFNNEGKLFCNVHTHVAQIDINGDWTLCCIDYARSFKFGSLLNEGILDIWHKPMFVELRKQLLLGNPQLHVCKVCNCFNSPHG